MAKSDNPIAPAAPSARVAAFLDQMAKTPVVRPGGGGGRLIFALDATMSRQPTWDTASALQAEMFQAAASTGGLRIQLVSFRGAGEFHARPFTDKAADLTKAMSGYGCRGGFTQVGRVLRHAADEAAKAPVQALVYVGDALEEKPDTICGLAGRLGLTGVPAFVFQEGRDAGAEQTFREVARLTKGAYARFDAGSAAMLRDLLKAVAIFASGGRKALADHAKAKGGAALLLTRQMTP
jgi:hypothetical protein